MRRVFCDAKKRGPAFAGPIPKGVIPERAGTAPVDARFFVDQRVNPLRRRIVSACPPSIRAFKLMYGRAAGTHALAATDLASVCRWRFLFWRCARVSGGWSVFFASSMTLSIDARARLPCRGGRIGALIGQRGAGPRFFPLTATSQLVHWYRFKNRAKTGPKKETHTFHRVESQAAGAECGAGGSRAPRCVKRLTKSVSRGRQRRRENPTAARASPGRRGSGPGTSRRRHPAGCASAGRSRHCR